MGKFSCKDCPNRSVDCHTWCETYKAEKVVNDTQVAQRREKHRIDGLSLSSHGKGGHKHG